MTGSRNGTMTPICDFYNIGIIYTLPNYINKNLFQETLYDAKLKPSEEGLEETLEVTMKQVIMMMTVGEY